MSIKVEKVSQVFQNITALDAIDLDIPRGGLVILSGKNGSGKSTLLKCMAGIQKPTSGTVTIEGRPAGQSRHKVSLAIQFPEKALFGRTVYDDLAFAPKNKGLQPAGLKACVNAAKEAVGLSDELLAQPHTSLSYGQKRLAGLACVLSGRPEYLFLDEPTAGLDYQGKLRINLLLEKLIRSGVTIVVASHDPSRFSGIASRLIVLEAGRIVVDSMPVKADLTRAGFRSETLELARRLNGCGFNVGETCSPEELAESVAEVIRRESADNS